MVGSPARAGDLVANPRFTRELPPPGWIADHHDEWLREHPVYQSKCQAPDVSAEIQFLNRVIGIDEYLLSLTTTPDAGNPAAERQARLARHDMETLRRDVATVDALVAQLRALSPCDSAQAAAQPAKPTIAQTPPTSTPTAGTDANRFVMRFDDHVAALTPSSIRAFNAAVDAALAGKKVQLTIEGCASAADSSRDSTCTRRRQSLARRLAENGVKKPERLLADPR
ncbi:MAG TPA: hypothetical protein VM782_11665 [Stellaceae bacterium]|nr:hypothetical protein [Stellaceae bacterium]